MLKMEDLPWKEVEISGYDRKKNIVKYLTETAMWGADGFHPIATRWILVRDPTGEIDPLPLMSTDISLTAIQIIELYVDRWGLEVTFQEVRENLGVETQKQWSDKAIVRTTPILMALYTIVCLIGHRLNEETLIITEKTAWYDKDRVTFTDLLKAVRIALWKDNLFFRKEFSDTSAKIQLENEELKKIDTGFTSANAGLSQHYFAKILQSRVGEKRKFLFFANKYNLLDCRFNLIVIIMTVTTLVSIIIVIAVKKNNDSLSEIKV